MRRRCLLSKVCAALSLLVGVILLIPRRLELAKHPDVLEVAVVARPHTKWGERAMAYVHLHTHSAYHPSKHSSSPSPSHPEAPHRFVDELKKFSTKVLPGFARPEWVEVVHELPKTGTGKVLKHVLREKAREAGRSEDGKLKAKL